MDETAPIGTEVGVTAFASDADGTATVSYSIEDNRNGSAFKIDPATGVLTLNTELNREYYEDIDINVRATSSDRSTSEKTFTIAVNDIDEFDVTEIINGDYRPIGVSEDAEIGQRIFQAEARDEDATDEVTFSIANAGDVPFAIDSKTGEVTVSRSMDEDEVASYTLEIVADSTDGSQSRKSFEVAVRDIDEFGVSELTDVDDTPNAVDENTEGGALVGITAFADDPDATDEVTYSIWGDFSPFEIDPKTGVITVSNYAKLDAETKPVEIIQVVARSSFRNASSFDFEVAIRDVNEFEVGRPFDKDEAPDEVKENAPVGTPVGITAFAEDLDQSDTVTYRMARKGDDWYSRDNELFAVDRETGVVTVAGPIDFEKTGRAEITVVAVSSDGVKPSNPFASPETRFDIRILPVNEFDLTPFVDTDEAPNEISENAKHYAPAGVTLKTSDADEGVYKYSFEIVDAAGKPYWEGPFTVDSDGKITVDEPRKLMDLQPGPHTFLVKATSNDGSERTEKVTINLIGAKKWRDNPKGPRVDTDYPTVPDADRRACVAADEDRSSPATYNNEKAYFDCLEKAVPPIVYWRDNPKDPRGNDLTVYDGIPHDDLGACIRADSDETSPTFNNEKAYYDCLDDVLKRLKPGTGTQTGLIARINECAAVHKVYYEAPRESQARMTVTNTGATVLRVYPVTAPDAPAQGAPSAIATVGPGKSAEFKAPRQSGFAVLGSGDACVGAIKAWESRNGRSFGQEAGTVAGTGDPSGGGSCSGREGLVSKYLEDPASVTVANTGSTPLKVYWINYSGADTNYEDVPEPMSVVQPGQSAELNAYRGFVFSVLNEAGQCVGLARAQESGNSYSFADAGTAEPGTNTTRNRRRDAIVARDGTRRQLWHEPQGFG